MALPDREDELEFADQADADEDIVEEIPKEQRVLRTQAYDKSVSDIVAMVRAGDIILDPEYQRNYIWDNKKASLLIESILLNVPIPVVYVSEEDDSRWSIVDGLQRINSLRRFFDNEFKLRGLEVLTELNGLQYSTLNPKASRVLRNGIIRIILIFKESHPEIKYDIFMRLNRGAIKLNEQELRNCLYRGPLNDLLMRARTYKPFLTLIGLSAPHKRMADAELVLRYLTISANYDPVARTVRNYAGKVKSALNRFCESNKGLSPQTAEGLETTFRDTVDKVHLALGTAAFQRMNEDGTTDGRVNRAIMDCVMTGFEGYSLAALQAHMAGIKNALRLLPLRDQAFADAITFATSDKKRLEYRLNAWHETLRQIIES